MDDRTCKCSKFYKNLKLKKFRKIQLSSFYNNNKYLHFLDSLHNNKISLNLINNLNNYYGVNFCIYQRKWQIIAFLIESISFIGIGHFYLFRFFQGLFKMGLSCSLILSIFIYKKIKSSNKRNNFIICEEKNNAFRYIFQKSFEIKNQKKVIV